MEDLVIALRIMFASNFVLYLKTHHAHVNVTGMFFPSLHLMFGDQYENLQEQIDTIAEKIRQLDVPAPMSISEITQQSAIADHTGTTDAQGYLTMLLLDHEKMLVILSHAFKAANEAHADGISNYIQDRMDWHAKTRWQLKATSSNLSSR